MDKAKEYLGLVKQTIDKLDQSAINAAAQAFLDAYHKGGNIYVFGNGGSGATASHVAGDFLKGASYGLDKRFKMICLNDNIASMMAIANDIGYEDIFIEPLKNFIGKDDLVIGISGSGNSENVVRAMTYAKDQGVKTLALSGFNGGKISRLADISVHADVMDMEVCEDIHMIIFNIIKKEMQATLMGDNPSMGKVYDDRVS
ncbi:phosphoheptose isomerase [Owenweeksia hongkongensis DSM 17368]|uniref:Phosphoheptose isomerase n=1 Tax=Owenweeksia hongkongensis (strain DSM 17368 / CIP 108786 / JCM 12287 / NRRL B-23963 / UST20020801) TaxID=926562 RepID=G8R6L1_OWEHD|nr:SIS domain-containing protein [Owenweeksia hongkongensis]AEV31154.1 phosphoheptose isomerase [Owenweeksia hongkongensis DSM 17368]